MKLILRTLLFTLTIVGNTTAQESITNGSFWQDTEGHRIGAHGGGFIWVQDTCFWIGEDKSHNQAQFKAINCYASTDLINWTFRKTLLKAKNLPRNAFPKHLGYVMERPKVIFNESTKKYVMYVHYDGQNVISDNFYAKAAVAVFQSNKVDGDYTFDSSFKPEGMDSRDMTIFKDDNGKAYLFSSSNGNKDMAIFRLSKDYLSIEKHVSTQWKNGWREAPSPFKHKGIYYLIASGCTGWAANQGTYATTTDIEGDWSIHQNIADEKTYESQACYILPVIGKETTTYIYCGDRWNGRKLGNSKYIWLPLTFKDDKLIMDWHKSWTVDVETGQWKSRQE